MDVSWRPDNLAIFLLRATRWRVALVGGALQIALSDRDLEIPIRDLKQPIVTPGLFWSDVELTTIAGSTTRLTGIRNRAAGEMQAAINAKMTESWRDAFESACGVILAWAEEIGVRTSIDRWVTEEEVSGFTERCPTDADLGMDIRGYLRTPEGRAAETALPDSLKSALRMWTSGHCRSITARNERWLEGEVRRQQHFFDRVEKSPLTDEQAKAVACFENRVLVVASAGSGKTATMVARAGYALHRGIVKPEEILMLAFNKDAAVELEQRVKDRLAPLSLPADRVTAKTFHAFGLQVIGQATGKKPRVAAWLDSGKDIEAMSDLIDELRDADRVFRFRWDVFRFVFDEDLPGFEEEEVPEDWDPETRRRGFRTHRGEVVKSREERAIANWYFLNGVDYQYEAPYEHDVAAPNYSQYRPDFYLPGAGVYHEHFALNAAGQPPERFPGYLSGVRWKKSTHLKHQTELLVTTSAMIRSGEAFVYLAKELERLGISLDPNPDRTIQGTPLIAHKELASLFRSFLTHAKSNRLSVESLKMRLRSQTDGTFKFRHLLFLELYERIASAWNKRLADAGEVDFEDMLNAAAGHLEFGRYRSPYKLVMVDEFQDASQARARLVRALVDRPHRFLFAVGDDWQSINRFAGADISVMTHFHREFGQGVTLHLGRTFRCPQSLCDISSSFVAKNPMQIRKRVVSRQPEPPRAVRIVSVPDRNSSDDAIEAQLERLFTEHQSAERSGRPGHSQSVLLLGRYRASCPARLTTWVTRFESRLSIRFMTVHGSKGLEADHVFILEMTRGGFPCFKEDDPLLTLAMPEKETFRFSEERRLFYVALTRARRGVTVFTQEGRESEFLVEITEEHAIPVERTLGGTDDSEPCPKCGRGRMVLRTSKFGPFFGCSTFPRCDHKYDVGRQKDKRSSRMK